MAIQSSQIDIDPAKEFCELTGMAQKTRRRPIRAPKLGWT
jgi:hypothetical protein